LRKLQNGKGPLCWVYCVLSTYPRALAQSYETLYISIRCVKNPLDDIKSIPIYIIKYIYNYSHTNKKLVNQVIMVLMLRSQINIKEI